MTTLRRGDHGLTVTRLEIALAEMGLYQSGLDDIFGGGMEQAVREYQRLHGLSATGEADPQTAASILAERSPTGDAMEGQPTEYRALSLTAGFETSRAAPDCFSGLAGDFDGQGINFGVLQWNLGQGTLQTMLHQLHADHPSVLPEVFESGWTDLESMLGGSRTSQLEWARGLQTSTRRSLVEPWKSRFRRLGATTECQSAQLAAAASLFRKARRLCDEYGLWSERGLALMFDIVVQNGSIRSNTRDAVFRRVETLDGGLSSEQREVEVMRAVANLRAEASRAAYVEDVRRRKLTIANGIGIVHGRGYDLERQYLLGLHPLAPQ